MCLAYQTLEMLGKQGRYSPALRELAVYWGVTSSPEGLLCAGAKRTFIQTLQQPYKSGTPIIRSIL